MKNVKEIMTKWLIENGHDGLCRECCGCDVKDLMPCSFDQSCCVPAKKIIITQENIDDYEDAEIGAVRFIPSDNVTCRKEWKEFICGNQGKTILQIVAV